MLSKKVNAVKGDKPFKSWLAEAEEEWAIHHAAQLETVWDCAKPRINHEDKPLGGCVIFGTTPMTKSEVDPYMSYGFSLIQFFTMKTYIGTKIIEATPMCAGAAKSYLDRPISDVHKNDDPGYLVRYPDGYESWSPAEAFDEAYRETQGMSFGLALEATLKGHAVARRGWNGENMCVFMTWGTKVPRLKMKLHAQKHFQEETVDIVPHLDMKDAQGRYIAGWSASQLDMLSTDWFIVE